MSKVRVKILETGREEAKAMVRIARGSDRDEVDKVGLGRIDRFDLAAIARTCFANHIRFHCCTIATAHCPMIGRKIFA